MVDLLARHHRNGRRFEPTELVEHGSTIAVGLNVRDPGWSGTGETYKVFTFGDAGEAVLLQDCVSREEALAHLQA